MAKIQNISEIHPVLGFTEFDVLEKYRKSFHESELGRLHSAFRLSIWRKPQVCLNVIRVAGIYSVLAQRKEGFKDKDAQTSYDRTS